MKRKPLTATLVCSAVLIVPVSAVLAWLIFARKPLPATACSGVERENAQWWAMPSPLTDGELDYAEFLSSVTWRLPREQWHERWHVGGRQLGVSSIRYQAAFAGYAFAALGMRTPAYPAPASAGLSNAVEHLLAREAWSYVSHYWRGKPWFPDPVQEENIMYSGHLLQLMVMYEALIGDARFRKKGFDFVWDQTTVIHYTTTTLAEAISRQMRRNACGGVACEPGRVFFPCNNHPQVALLMMERMGLGEWQGEREKWEKFALGSYRAHLGGAIALFYHIPSNAFIPAGYPGLDAWSLLWYQPWATDPSQPGRIWKYAAKFVDWQKYAGQTLQNDSFPQSRQETCCRPEFLPDSVVASFLFPAAVACGDFERAQTLKHWLDCCCVERTNRMLRIKNADQFQIGATANMAIGELLAGGSDLRALVQNPLPDSYFDGPFITDALPEEARIYQAYRTKTELVIDLYAPAEARLTLAHAEQLASNSIQDEAPVWRRDGNRLIVAGKGRRLMRIPKN